MNDRGGLAERNERALQHLPGAMRDTIRVYECLGKRKIFSHYTMSDQLDANEARQRFDQLLSNDGVEALLFVIYYTGHGERKRGAWCFANDTYVQPRELFSKWRQAKGDGSIRQDDKLLLVCDSCFSGRWAEFAIPHDDVAVQAASRLGSQGAMLSQLSLGAGPTRQLAT